MLKRRQALAPPAPSPHTRSAEIPGASAGASSRPSTPPARPPRRGAAEPPLTCEDVEAFVRETKPTTEGAAGVTWATGPGGRGVRVGIHGWAACRQEIAPTPQLLARALGANLYCPASRARPAGEESASASPPDGD